VGPRSSHLRILSRELRHFPPRIPGLSPLSSPPLPPAIRQIVKLVRNLSFFPDSRQTFFLSLASAIPLFLFILASMLSFPSRNSFRRSFRKDSSSHAARDIFLSSFVVRFFPPEKPSPNRQTRRSFLSSQFPLAPRFLEFALSSRAIAVPPPDTLALGHPCKEGKSSFPPFSPFKKAFFSLPSFFVFTRLGFASPSSLENVEIFFPFPSPAIRIPSPISASPFSIALGFDGYRNVGNQRFTLFFPLHPFHSHFSYSPCVLETTQHDSSFLLFKDSHRLSFPPPSALLP